MGASHRPTRRDEMPLLLFGAGLGAVFLGAAAGAQMFAS